jgi:hypothetical protein
MMIMIAVASTFAVAANVYPMPHVVGDEANCVMSIGMFTVVCSDASRMNPASLVCGNTSFFLHGSAMLPSFSSSGIRSISSITWRKTSRIFCIVSFVNTLPCSFFKLFAHLAGRQVRSAWFAHPASDDAAASDAKARARFYSAPGSLSRGQIDCRPNFFSHSSWTVSTCSVRLRSNATFGFAARFLFFLVFNILSSKKQVALPRRLEVDALELVLDAHLPPLKGKQGCFPFKAG